MPAEVGSVVFRNGANLLGDFSDRELSRASGDLVGE
jgi:hypothetical protein